MRKSLPPLPRISAASVALMIGHISDSRAKTRRVLLGALPAERQPPCFGCRGSEVEARRRFVRCSLPAQVRRKAARTTKKRTSRFSGQRAQPHGQSCRTLSANGPCPARTRKRTSHFPGQRAIAEPASGLRRPLLEPLFLTYPFVDEAPHRTANRLKM